ncbi:uncharacterized protein LOC123536679 [Mercenaria mercenaria]|uniref:uncharacterized protein LOC123536679 n=1 Tax=Mercenaria mercenaria TaxID=6596 RepID=UPI00234F0DB3|nr:uncharacterized protein LOC123536679 [Mercenaria mercenaria]XP_053384434.1 uncharacterized protein LOC123536679 [Mercenaria mercenaria]
MSDTGSQLSAEFERNVETEATDVSAILVMEDNKVLTAERRKVTLYDEDFQQITKYEIKEAGWWGMITDMTLTGQHTFSLLLPGFWYESWLVSFEITEESQIKKRKILEIKTQAFGLCYQREFFFVTFSPKHLIPFRKNPPGYICMINKKGENRHTFKNDGDNKNIFGSSLSKIYVDQNFKMFVCDKEKNEIVILQIDPFTYAATVITRHKYSVMDIATKVDRTSFLATNHKDGVVLLHANGRWVFNNFLSSERLNGTPTALAYNEGSQQLMVSVRHSQWFRQKKWLLFQIYIVKYSQDTDTRVSIEN